MPEVDRYEARSSISMQAGLLAANVTQNATSHHVKASEALFDVVQST